MRWRGEDWLWSAIYSMVSRIDWPWAGLWGRYTGWEKPRPALSIYSGARRPSNSSQTYFQGSDLLAQ